MTNYSGASFEEQVAKALEGNQKDLQEIKTDLKKIKKYILFGKIMNVIYLILIIAPLIIAIFFLPQIIKSFTNNYLNQVLPDSANLDLKDILENYSNLIK